MKKKILALCLVVALAATAVIGGTLAYFTDTDTEDNIFTVGNIKIDLEETFEQGSKLMPGSVNRNNVKKEVWVKNTGSNPAYMWIEVLIPDELDDSNAANNALHFNAWDTYLVDGKYITCSTSTAEANGYGTRVAVTEWVDMGVKQDFPRDDEGNIVIDENVGMVNYHSWLIYIKNDSAKVSGATTAKLLSQVYMDEGVEQCTEHDGCYVLPNGTHYDRGWNLIVNAYGIQAEGFTTIEDAINAYYGETVIE